MKNLLFLLVLAVISFTAFSQVTVSIVSVTTTTRDVGTGDSIVIAISAPNNDIYGIWVSDGDPSDGNYGGFDNPHAASYGALTYAWYFAVPPDLKKERTYIIGVWVDNGDIIYSDPYTVGVPTAKRGKK